MPKRTYTTFNIAKLLDVYPTTVANWINSGKLKAFTTPGGHRRVERPDLLKFLKDHNMPIPREIKESLRDRILIVDDDELVLKSIVNILERSKKEYDLSTAASGFQAGHSLSNFCPNLVILDLMLPGIDGFRICTIIKKYDPSIKVLAITGYNSDENRAKILASGADGFLPKPFEKNVLLSEVEKLLKNES